jgi:hypothetical protein
MFSKCAPGICLPFGTLLGIFWVLIAHRYLFVKNRRMGPFIFLNSIFLICGGRTHAIHHACATKLWPRRCCGCSVHAFGLFYLVMTSAAPRQSHPHSKRAIFLHAFLDRPRGGGRRKGEGEAVLIPPERAPQSAPSMASDPG